MATQLFRGQTLLQIKLETGYDLTGATVKIRYRKPGGAVGEWTDVTTDGTKVVYQVKAGDIDRIGSWQFQAVVTAGGRTAAGGIHSETISEPI